MRLKRIALLLSVTMLLSIIGIPSYAQDDYAVLTFGKGGKQVQMSTNVVADNTVRDGMEAIILDPDDSSANMNIYMGNSFSMLSDGTCVILSVTYYDEGEGKFTLFYDGVNGQTEHPDIVRLKNTCTWKTKVYELQNPKFNKSVGGADIKISLKTEAMDKSAGKIIISEVKVEKTEYKSVYLADISTDGRPGNIYFSDEEVAFGVKIRKNDTMQVYSDNCDITYYICDDDGNVIWNKTEENVDIRQGYNEKIVPEGLKYGLYDFYVTIENKNCCAIKYTCERRRMREYYSCPPQMGTVCMASSEPAADDDFCCVPHRHRFPPFLQRNLQIRSGRRFCGLQELY